VTVGNADKSRVVYKTYERWDTESPPLPARSRLFNLQPIGIGTAQVESLTSYIARLSAEHCVSPRKLLCAEILAPIGKVTHHYAFSPYFSAHQINGTGELAKVTALGFEKLTLRHDLRHTTLQMWGNTLSHQLLLRNNRAWCQSCYKERLDAKEPPYELLLWSLKDVTSCTRHGERLCAKCPLCKRQLPFLATDYCPGYCSGCGHWLGTHSIGTSKRPHERITKAELSRQFQIQHVIGELLSTSASFVSPPSRQTFTANLIRLIEKHAKSNINEFSDMVGMWSGTVRRLLASESKLALGNLYLICSRLGVAPTYLLAEQGNEEYLKRRHIVVEDIPSLQKTTSWSEIGVKLEAALQEYPPPSMESVARNLGCNPPKVRRHFPELCERLISRYKQYQKNRHPSPAEIRRAFRTALEQFPPPSLQMVLRGLGCKSTGYYYYYNYRNLCLKVSRRFLKYLRTPFHEDKDRKRLEAMLVEEPPPSFSEVARRFKRKRDFLRRKFPELSKAVTARYKHYQGAMRKNNGERLRSAITEAVRQVIASGQYASERRVKKLVRQQLPHPGRDSLFKRALREVKAEMGLTG
jgi:AcrR family transcriptional regulator